MTTGSTIAQLDEAIQRLQALRDSISDNTPVPEFVSEQQRIRGNYPMEDRHWKTEGGEERLRALIHWVKAGQSSPTLSQQSVFADIHDPEGLVKAVLDKIKVGREQGYTAVGFEAGPFVMPVRLSAETSDEPKRPSGEL